MPADENVVVSDSAHGYTFTLLKVTPYPRAGEVTPDEDYSVWLRVDPAISAPAVSPTSIETTLGVPFELRLNAEATVAGEGLEIQFTGVPKDSRCPLDIMCAWSGVVGLEFVATAPGGATQRSVLGGYADPQGDVRPVMETGTAPLMWLDGYTITSERVQPYPAHDDLAIAPEAYVATLIVTKDEQESDNQAIPTPTTVPQGADVNFP
jgi:hypothetical protein